MAVKATVGLVIKPGPVIDYFQADIVCMGNQNHRYFRWVSVLQGIVDCFLGDPDIGRFEHQLTGPRYRPDQLH